MANPWSKAELDFIAERLELFTCAIVKDFNNTFNKIRSYDSIQKKVKALREVYEKSDPLFQFKNDYSKEFQNNYIQEVTSTPTFIKFYAKESVIKEDTDEEFIRITQNAGRLKPHLDKWLHAVSKNFTPRQHKYQPSNAASLVLFLSDLHFGQQASDFNIEVAKERLLAIPEMLCQETFPKLDEIVVVLGGDLVEGEDIFSNQNIGLECPVFMQIQEVTSTLWQLLLDLQMNFDIPVRVETVFGNHGRPSKTADQRSNWDNIVHMQLSLLAEHVDAGITVNLNFEEFLIVQIKDKTGLVNHQGTKHLGTPAMQTKFAGWLFPEGYDFMMHGHWHHWQIGAYLGKPMISNGSLPGGSNDLAYRMALQAEPARQAFFLVENNKPIKMFGFLEW